MSRSLQVVSQIICALIAGKLLMLWELTLCADELCFCPSFNQGIAPCWKLGSSLSLPKRSLSLAYHPLQRKRTAQRVHFGVCVWLWASRVVVNPWSNSWFPLLHPVGAAQLITIHRVQGELTMAVLISICDEGCRRDVASRWPVRLQLHARMECSLWIGSLLVKKYAGNLLADSRCCGRFFRDWQKHNDGVCFPVLFEIHLIHFFATSLLMIRQISLEPYLKHSFPNKPQTYNHVGWRYGRGQKENDR